MYKSFWVFAEQVATAEVRRKGEARTVLQTLTQARSGLGGGCERAKFLIESYINIFQFQHV